MHITIIHGQSHKGSTYHIARMLAEKIGGDIDEFFLPRDFGEFCVGCCCCIEKDENLCPHREKLLPLIQSIDKADLIILASPVYVYHATGAMKSFLDHFAYRWMVHRPESSMFKKQGVAISTAAGAGMKSTNKDMTDSLFFWGTGKIYSYGVAISAVDWKSVTDKKKSTIEKKISRLSKKIIKNEKKVKPGLKTKAFFKLMSLMQKNGWCEVDKNYWNENGWTKKNRPWKYVDKK